MFNQSGLTGHFEKPRRIVAMQNHADNPFRVTAAGTGSGEVIQISGLFADRDFFREL